MSREASNRTRCPVCRGTGLDPTLPHRFTSGGHNDRTCGQCHGECYVYSSNDGETSVNEREKTAYEAGVAAAKADIAAGRLVYRWGGHAGHWGHWVVSQLTERFGVRVNDGFGVCFVTASSLAFDDGYNSVLSAEINQRHGDGAFEAVFSESRQQTEEALRAAKESWLAGHQDAEPAAAPDRGESA